MQQEYTNLIKNHTWGLVPLPYNKKAIGCKWVFLLKENYDGSLNRYKVRLVTKGFHQIQGFDFHEMFSPVIKLVTIRLIITLSLTNYLRSFPIRCQQCFLKWPSWRLCIYNHLVLKTILEGKNNFETLISILESKNYLPK